MYNFKLDDFEGPLDLLLHLIKESKMDIKNIEIVSLTNQYLDYIKGCEELNIVIASQYLTMASELIYLKSRCLLPMEKEEDEELESAKEELINRLTSYQNYKEMTKIFKKLEEKRKEVYTKTPSSLKDFNLNKVSPNCISMEELLNAFQKYLDRKKYLEPLTTTVTTKELSIEDRSMGIRNLLNNHNGKIEFFELFENVSKPYVVVTFLSILEMAKNKELIITQENNFSKIYCERVDNL